jgi:hypothetical protein
MDLKKFAVTVLGVVFFILISLHCSAVYSAENLPLGSKLPDFELKGPASPQTKAYLGVNNEKLFPLSQIKTKVVLIEFFDVF